MSISIAVMGLAIGILVGLTGVGGAALLTPLLILLGINPSIAVGTDLIYNSVTKFFGLGQHWKQGTINFKLVKYLSVGSVPSAMVAIGTLHLFPIFHQHQEQIIKYALGYILTLVAVSFLIRIFFDKKIKPNRWQMQPLEQKKALTIIIGVIFGFIVGLTSIGSGSLFAIAMLFFYRMNTSELVGTDITHAFFLVTVAGILNASLGSVDYMLAANLLIGSIPGVSIGSRLSTKAPSKLLQVIIATIILISGLSLI
ncbi:sulfite exporter TauE/SafE family protein [Priestia aryabhattai]|uniref:sulfite exporter TauE/SafE family protein n=1 Tax=Priestia aryabhattai TaxID=412384 RepID=UPI001CCB46CA|nr:sulfite exporter TauE/SafE family protein [Priestia aryabhattai]MBZ6488423.1 sulfite exporter TauE/SafE family protein [Priestia aryabhattai]MDH3111193.1 sulfite exporter TauE/SafE family protein [Priestia aryabhattai]MDH3111201.1 sulfite exporter TauE/SafE family protein [Priestia aryabhattai]MDH3129690.1 sulfite exporter TauE/SafE family protein [Priestia aryabhattai]MDH3129698.1 sulfite exporter TauE/SafE family protein [Priestia aryabhattai]